MKTLKHMEAKIQELWERIQKEEEKQKNLLQEEYLQLLRTYKIQKLIVEG